jgi:sensor histidine kinase YesM
MQQAAWKLIQWQFMGKPNDPLIYRDYIFIKFLGEVSHDDSVCFKELNTDLEKILPERNRFQVTDQDANLTFTINASGIKSRKKLKDNGENITIRELEINIPKDAKYAERLKIIYFHLYRSLVHFSPAYVGSQKVPGCVFDEEDPEAITFHPLDKFILSKLYSPDFQEQFKSYFMQTNSLSEYYRFRYKDKLTIIGISGGLMLSILLISILISLNAFRKHNWNYRPFLVQVLWGIIVYNIFCLFNILVQEYSIPLIRSTWFALLAEDLFILVVAIIFFFVEKKIQFSSLSSKAKTLLLLVDTIVISYLISFILVRFVAKESGYNVFFIPLFIMLIITTARFFMISLSGISNAELKQKDSELVFLRERSKQAELDSLRAKINPHFLYNALNSIASLATTDARKTEQMALALSDFFKYAINREQKQLNTLSEELNAIRTYLEIEKVRFGERLSFEIDCPPELLDIKIPQLLIQPLVENAIKHGLSQITENGLIRILISKEECQLKIRVYDNGPAFPDGPLTGFGIQNTQERIALLYGAKATINWHNGAEKYIEISIPV